MLPPAQSGARLAHGLFTRGDWDRHSDLPKEEGSPQQTKAYWSAGSRGKERGTRAQESRLTTATLRCCGLSAVGDGGKQPIEGVSRDLEKIRGVLGVVAFGGAGVRVAQHAGDLP